MSSSEMQHTVVDKAVRDDGEFGTRLVHIGDAFAHGVQTLQRQLLGLVGQDAKNLVDLVRRLEGERRKTHLHLLALGDI